MKDRYQIKETSFMLSFQPFYHHRTKLKWYVLAISIFGGLSAYYYEPLKENFLIICTTFFLITCWFFLKELLFSIPIRYTFDQSANAVYQSNLFVSKRRIMRLDEVVIYQSSEIESWQYEMGKKKRQFVKSYAISEYFSDSEKNNKRQMEFERKILSKINQMIQLQGRITANERRSTISV